jgi:hypothetical protein
VLVDGRGAQEGEWPRRETEEDLTEHVLVERQGFRILRRLGAAATAAAGHSDAIPVRVDLGMEAQLRRRGIRIPPHWCRYGDRGQRRGLRRRVISYLRGRDLRTVEGKEESGSFVVDECTDREEQ